MIATYQIAMAAGRDAANRQMRAEGREASRHAQMSVSLFAVDRYCDQIRVKATRETLIGSDDKYHYFESECEAHAFIRRRAFEAFLKAEAATVKARLRYNRACRKFPNLIAKVTA